MTGAELRARIAEMLGHPAGHLMALLVKSHPTQISREDAAAHVGYGNVRSKGFQEALGRLSQLGFVSSSNGKLGAAPILFQGTK